MKKLCSLFLTICLAVSLTGCKSAAPETTADTNQTGAFKEGTYTVSANGINGEITLDVTFTKDELSEIKVVSHSETAGISDPAFEKIPAQAVEYQSLAMDTVTGCTLSSNGIIAALEKAVEAAGGDVEAMKAKKIEKDGPGETVEKTADVIVIGGGGAGLSSATSAIQEGASVILVEKTASLGGNTILAGGPINAADPEWQKTIESQAGEAEVLKAIMEKEESEIANEYLETFRTLKVQIEEYLSGDQSYLFDSTELHTIQTYLGSLRSDVDGNEIYGQFDLVTTLTNNVLSTVNWLDELGVNFRDTIAMPVGAMWRRGHKPETNKGVEYINVLGDAIRDNGGEILLETTATSLIETDERVTGVKAVQADGTEVILTANKGVIIATGGFAANTEMVKEYNTYWTEIPDEVKTTNAIGQTGDGILMGQEVGANLVGMGFAQFMPVADPIDGQLFTGLITPPANYVFVNQEGNRFVNEVESRDVLTKAALEQGGLFYMIADANIRDLAENTSPEKIQSEIEKGIIIEADTLEELAEKIGVDKDTFLATIEKYNNCVEEGKDEEFGKSTFDLKIEQAPFYATPRQPATHHTMGGLQIDTNTHVLREDGTIISGLYAAGEVTGGIHGGNRLGGNALADIFTFGKIAGATAAKGE